ncbi:MAG: plasmid recombination protein, partial [Bacillus sp. (in: Bacteria)]|nr:plasmid recombination protein [Bacillus sp. (in: firmicutes)]
MGEFAWHFEKMKRSDVKGIENEVEREGKLKNEDIDPSRSHLNKELVDNPGGMTLYQRVKKRVDVVKENGNRVQKNSVNLLSSVITFPKEDNDDKTEEEQELYFKICLAYFQKKFGKENVVSAIIHKDESRPHMHLQQVPVTKDNRLAARDVMKKSDVNQVHDELPKYLRHYGFNVQRGSGKTENNVRNIHAYKDIKKREEEISKEQVRLKNLENQIRSSNAAELKRKEKELKEKQEIELAKKEKEMLARVKKEHNKVENYYTDVKNYHSRINKALEQAKGYMDDVGQFIDQQSSNIFEENREVLKLEIEMG